MSSYDDPRWYEQPEPPNTQVNPSEQPPSDSYTSFQPPQQFNNDSNGLQPDQSMQPMQPIQPVYPMQPTPNKKRHLSKTVGKYVLVSTLILIAFAGGWFGNQYYNNSFALGTQSQSYANLFQQAWSIVDQHYVDRKAVDYKQMSYQAIQAMLAVLNDKGHTRFLSPSDVQSENQQLSGTFTGIGIYLRQDPQTKQVIITSPIPGSPAEKAGFKHGDIILAVNGVSTVGKDIPGISTLIQGKAGTAVDITVQRPPTNQKLTIHVLRAEIKVPNVLMHYIAQDHIADIQMVQFADGVSSQLRDDITQAKKDGATKIVLDLRENPGGYLSEAISTASEFIPKGNVLLEQNSTGTRTPYAVNGQTVDTTDPIVVLVNGDTASAAEIVSGALQDNHRAIIIGEKTYGTGTVLQEYSLSDGSAILLGTAEWLTPNGQFIRGQGITPNMTVKLNSNITPLSPTDENASNMTLQQILSSGDTQLVAAIQYLEKH